MRDGRTDIDNILFIWQVRYFKKLIDANLLCRFEAQIAKKEILQFFGHRKIFIFQYIYIDQGGRGHWTVNYTGTQSFTQSFTQSLLISWLKIQIITWLQ